MPTEMELLYLLDDPPVGWIPNEIIGSFNVTYLPSCPVEGTLQEVKKKKFSVLMLSCKDSSSLSIIQTVRSKNASCFIIVMDDEACEKPEVRMDLFNKRNINMLTCHKPSIISVLKEIITISSSQGPYKCPRCKVDKLSEDALWLHEPLYHANAPNDCNRCVICKKSLKSPWAVHLHNRHGPIGRGEQESPEAAGNHPSLYSFALVLCRHPVTKKYLVVQEFSNSGYWLPGGAVDPGENMQIAAKRETLEEAGINVEIKGVLRTELTPRKTYVRLRVIFYAEPIGEELPKSIPDYESVGATWITAEEIKNAHLRGSEPLEWSTYLENGGPIYPLSTLTSERDPVVIPH